MEDTRAREEANSVGPAARLSLDDEVEVGGLEVWKHQSMRDVGDRAEKVEHESSKEKRKPWKAQVGEYISRLSLGNF